MSLTTSISLYTSLACCGAIIFIGSRFILAPQLATRAYGVAPGNARALTAIKGVRDIVSGIVPFVIWRVAGQQAFGWAMVTAALTPIGDAIIVLTNGGKASDAFGIHGATAAALVAAGLILGLDA